MLIPKASISYQDLYFEKYQDEYVSSCAGPWRAEYLRLCNPQVKIETPPSIASLVMGIGVNTAGILQVSQTPTEVLHFYQQAVGKMYEHRNKMYAVLYR